MLPEAEQTLLPEAAQAETVPQTEEIAVSEAAAFQSIPEDFKPSLALFQTLRQMAESLPEEKRTAFKESTMCEKLNQIIATLEG